MTPRRPSEALRAFRNPRYILHEGKNSEAVLVDLKVYKAVLKYLGDQDSPKELAALRAMQVGPLADYLATTQGGKGPCRRTDLKRTHT